MTINQRIKFLMESKNLNNNSLSKILGVTPQTLFNVTSDKGRQSDPSFEMVKQILSKFVDINSEWLILGEGEMYKSNQDNSDYLSEPSEPYEATIKPLVVTIDSSNNNNVALVPFKARAGYLSGFGDPEYISSLNSYSLPNLKNGIFRMFQVGGHSMHPTLKDGDYVVGQYVESAYEIKDNRVYVIISKSEGIIIKRVLNRLIKYGNLYCKSDNRKEYPNFSIEISDIQEVWEYKMHLSFSLTDPTEFFEKLYEVESDVEFLKNELKKIKLNSF